MAKLTVQFPEKTNTTLTALANDQDTTKTAIIRRAITLLKYVMRELNKEEGRRLIITDKDGTVVKELVMTEYQGLNLTLYRSRRL
mgnify:CR=1 FL=1